jgi:hypothetical protein
MVKMGMGQDQIINMMHSEFVEALFQQVSHHLHPGVNQDVLFPTGQQKDMTSEGYQLENLLSLFGLPGFHK